MDPETVDTPFDASRQESEGPERECEGVGLRRPIVRRLVMSGGS